MKYRCQRREQVINNKQGFFFALFECECVSKIKTWLGFLGFIGIFFHFLMRPMRCPEAKKTYAFAPRQLLREENAPSMSNAFLGYLGAFLQLLIMKHACSAIQTFIYKYIYKGPPKSDKCLDQDPSLNDKEKTKSII